LEAEVRTTDVAGSVGKSDGLNRAGSPRFLEILEEMKELHIRKSQDYGSDQDPLANVKSAVGWGVPNWVGVMIRLGDKVFRLQEFAKKGRLANEGALDSLRDTAAYAIIAQILYEEAA
jgi:hypothetical protein